MKKCHIYKRNAISQNPVLEEDKAKDFFTYKGLFGSEFCKGLHLLSCYAR
jgi:hypothetical protein